MRRMGRIGLAMFGAYVLSVTPASAWPTTAGTSQYVTLGCGVGSQGLGYYAGFTACQGSFLGKARVAGSSDLGVHLGLSDNSSVNSATSYAVLLGLRTASDFGRSGYLSLAVGPGSLVSNGQHSFAIAAELEAVVSHDEHGAGFSINVWTALSNQTKTFGLTLNLLVGTWQSRTSE